MKGSLRSPDLEIVLALRRLGGEATSLQVAKHLRKHGARINAIQVGAHLGRLLNEYVWARPLHNSFPYPRVWTLISEKGLPRRGPHGIWPRGTKYRRFDPIHLEHAMKHMGLLGKNLVDAEANDRLKHRMMEDIRNFG